MSVQSDVWAIGAILYELLSGRPPFEGNDPSVLHRIQNDEPPHLISFGLAIPRDLVNICHGCLQKVLSDRYQSASDLLDDLARFSRGEPVSVRPLGLLPRLGRWLRRRPAIAALAASLIVITIIGASGILWQWRRADFEARVARESAQRAESNLAHAQTGAARLRMAGPGVHTL